MAVEIMTNGHYRKSDPEEDKKGHLTNNFLTQTDTHNSLAVSS